MRFVALIAVAIGLGAAAPPEGDIAKFNRALADGRRTDAIAVVDKALHERDPGSGKLQSDPVLNALIGRVALASREFANAAIYLDRAPLGQLPPALRGPAALDHARALELTGQRKAAIAAYAEAAAIATESGRRSALYGQARLSLVDSPAAAQRLLAQAGEPNPGYRWEWEFLQSLASSLLGDRQSADRWAALAWQHSADAPREAQAPVQAAVLRAGLAAAAGDIGAERSMLQVTNGLVLRPSSDLTGQLPACDQPNVKPDDFVTFAALSGPYVGWRLVPVSASRIDVVQPFFDSIGRSSPFKDPGNSPVGTVFTVRCRSALSSTHASQEPPDPLLTWMVDRGAYPATLRNEAGDINAVVDRIDQITKRFGPNSPLLIGPRWQLMMMLVRSAAAGEAVQPGQVIDLSATIAEGMRGEGAPVWLSKLMTGQIDLARAQPADGDNQAKLPKFYAMLRAMLLEMPFDIAARYLIRQPELTEPAAEMVIALDGKAPATLAARDRQAWLIAVAEAQRKLGRDSQAKATINKAGLAPDLCLRSDTYPELLDQKFSYSDYPDDLIAGEQEGLSTFDFNLTPDGKVASQRIILSFPANVFDAVSAKGLATVRYSEPKRSGKPVGCRGLIQPIVWRLEDTREIDAFPLFSKGVWTPTS